ncbi:acetylxylan esterase [uncultured Kriegella sp.]|uniref:glucuronyl esterase domain-containing protein n=1 Tax=uncultured Kriegella sp. TaxID=1798910 RepID=UPI0030DB8657|tara:strand:- start:19604 stop:20869 length:1266 start_codon:yes stop_codon:yes gene_type:complete
MKELFFIAILFVFHTQSSLSQFEPNYEESKIPNFDLPDPLTTFDGKKISRKGQWKRTRRPELYAFFEENVYGKIPAEFNDFSAKVLEQGDNAINGKAKRRQVELSFEKNGRTLQFTMLIYLPKNVKKAPIFLGYNFLGNHTIAEDENIIISKAWARNSDKYGISGNKFTSATRGIRTNRWAVEKILDAGFGLATIYYGEVDPDKDDFSDGIHPFLYNQGQQKPDDNEWGSIAAWAWGYSRAMDYFEKSKEINSSKVVVFGHSRLGKTALWAGATDERFAAVISNDSGCGGAALSKRKVGETVGRINDIFPYWFCTNFKAYNNNEEALPVDQHELLALIAPRPLYVASAKEDQWADPKGEFLSAYHASEVYGLFKKEGIPTDQMPMVNQPIQNTLAYHIRTGIHDVTDFDWEQYIKWAKQQL